MSVIFISGKITNYKDEHHLTVIYSKDGIKHKISKVL